MPKRTWNSKQLLSAINNNRTWLGVCHWLNLSSSSTTLLKTRAKELGIDISHFSRKTLYEKDFLEKLVKESTSYNQILTKLGKGVGGNFRILKEYIKSYNIDTTHFVGKNQNYLRPIKDISVWLVEHSKVHNRSYIKIQLIKQGYKKKVCEICGISEWQGKPVPTELDHINGVRDDYRISNLRIICRNCGGLLPTYCRGSKGINSNLPIKKVKKVHVKQKQKICLKCDKPLCDTNKTGFCIICSKTQSKIKSRKVDRPSGIELEKLIERMPMTKIAEKFGVSDNAVRKWCRSYGIIIRKNLWIKTKNSPPKDKIIDVLYEIPFYKAAKFFEVSTGTLRVWVKRYGIIVPDNRYRSIKQWEKQKALKYEILTDSQNTI